MQSKNISLKIENKMNDWLSSITDEKLRDRVKDNLIVSGGCITSMFLNEKVNDYDIYIQNMSVLFDLASYYTKPYKDDVIVWDGRKKSEYKKMMCDILSDEDDEIESKTNGRGIAFKNLKSDQVKIYISSGKGGYSVLDERTSSEIEKDFNNEKNGEVKNEKYKPLYFTANAITLSDDIQIIIRFWGDPSEIHKNYDFIHATNYFTMKDKLVTNTKALESILSKQLYYQGSLFPITSIIRMRKFMKREWNINAGDILKILFQVSKLDLTDIDVLEEQLIGVDVFYFAKLIESLKSFHKSGNTLDSVYINYLIDEVFNSVMDTD